MLLRLHMLKDCFITLDVKLMDYGIDEYFFELKTDDSLYRFEQLKDLRRYQMIFDRFEILEDEFHSRPMSPIGSFKIEKYGYIPILVISAGLLQDWKLIGF